MRDLVLETLKRVIRLYPAILTHLSDKARKVLDDGVEWHQKFKPWEGEPSKPSIDWEITPEDIDDAIAQWDELMLDYKGMLDARVEIDPNKSVKDA